MNNLTMVFRGTHTFTFDLPSTAKKETGPKTVDVPGFEAVCDFRRLNELQPTEEPPFTFAQAICVTKIEDWDFRGIHNASVLVLKEAVRWVLCFPVVPVFSEELRYIPETTAIPPDGNDALKAFYFFIRSTPAGPPIRAVTSLDGLDSLSPQTGARLALIRAKAWRWDQAESVIHIFPQDVRDIEIILDSEVRTF
jgi:hypothetical protein